MSTDQMNDLGSLAEIQRMCLQVYEGVIRTHMDMITIVDSYEAIEHYIVHKRQLHFPSKNFTVYTDGVFYVVIDTELPYDKRMRIFKLRES